MPRQILPGERGQQLRIRPVAGILFTPPKFPNIRKHAKREQLTIATVNDDFTDKKTRVARLNKVTDVMLVQEAKNTNIRKVLKGTGSGVHQDRSSDDRAGSAVVWDRKDARATARGMQLASKKGQGILSRWITSTI